MKKLALSVISLGISYFLFAQNSAAAGEAPATGMRADGKIYVVMAVALTILIGLFIYLIRLERKISKLEKKSQ